MSDILQQKKASIDQCVKQVRDYYAIELDKSSLIKHMQRDAIVINLVRACEQCIDMANHVICVKKLGLPAGSSSSFTLLREANIIDEALEGKMIGMVGFRNTAVHKYQDIDYGIVEDVIKKHVDDLIAFAGILVAALPE